MVGHIHIMIIELLMKLDVILKNVGCTVTKMLDHNNLHGELANLSSIGGFFLTFGCEFIFQIVFTRIIKNHAGLIQEFLLPVAKKIGLDAIL